MATIHSDAWQGSVELQHPSMQAAEEQAVYTPDDFLAACKLTNVNLLDIVHALEQDHLVLKIAGYADTLAQQQSSDTAPAAGLLGVPQRGPAQTSFALPTVCESVSNASCVAVAV